MYNIYYSILAEVLAKKKIVLHEILVFEDFPGKILVVEDFPSKFVDVDNVMEVVMVDKKALNAAVVKEDTKHSPNR